MAKDYLDFEGLSTFFNGLFSKFSPKKHVHTKSEITDYVVDNELSSTSTNPVQNKVVNTGFSIVGNSINSLQTAINGKADASHNHNDAYYTESEIDSKFSAVNTSITNITNGDVIVKESEHAEKADSATTADEATHAVSADKATKATQLATARTISLTGDASGSASFNGTKNVSISVIVADDSHNHVISNVDGLQNALDEKAPSSHSHDDMYYTESEIDTKLSNKSDKTHNHDTAYDAKGSAEDALTEAKEYTNTVASGKANTSHGHSISDVSNLQSSLDAKVPTSRTVNGKALSSNITLSASDVGAATSGHTHGNYVNQNAFSNIKIGNATVSADTTTDTLEIVAGTGISVSGDVTNDKVTITNSGVRSISTGASSGTISVNINGTSVDVPVKGLGSAAYTSSDAYDAVGTAQIKADAALASAKNYIDEKIDAVVGEGASETLDTIGEISVAFEEHKDITETLNAAIGNKVDKVSGKGLSTNDYTTTEKNKLSGIASGAQVNQNAFSNVKVGDTTIVADTATDTLTLVGSNVTITPDTTNDKITIAVASGTTSTAGIVKLTNSTSSTSTTTAATPSSVKSAYDLANTAKTNAATAQTRADSAYNLAENKAVIKTLTSEDLDDVVKEGFYNAGGGNTVTNKPSGIEHFGLYVIHRASGAYYTQILIGNNTKSYRRHCDNGVWGAWEEDKLTDTKYTLESFGITATSAELNKLDGVTVTTDELNYVDGVTSNIQTQLDGKSASGHTHKYAGSSSVGGAATSANKLNTNAGSTTQPVYFADGIPKATTYTLGKSVPSDAKFTDTTYSNATTSAAGLMSSTDKSKIDYTNIAYATCSTASDTAIKVATLSGNTQWALKAGSIVVVKFSATNTAQNPTLNVNNTGAKSIWYNTAVITTSNLGYAGTANRPIIFVYDGTQYVFIGWAYDANTSYTNASLGQGYATCSTAAATVAKVGTLSSYSLTTGGIVSVKFSYDVPASATLNINSKGAKNIYFRGTAITADIIKAGDIATFIYSSQYHLISIDRWQNDLTTHSENATVHITSTERTNWNAAKTHADSAHAPSNAEANQNAFSNVKVGDTTIVADTKTDTLTLVAGSNITLIPDATNDKVTITAKDTVYTHPATSGNKHIPSGGSAGQVLKWSADGVAAWADDKDTTYSTAGTSLGLVKTGGDVTITDGVISVNDDSHAHIIGNIDGLQSALDGKAATSHGTHVSFSSTTPKVAGTASVGSATTVSRSDHVHPAQTSVSGNAGTATKLKTARTVDGVNFDGSVAITHYGTCSTDAGTVAKTVALTDFSLVTGARICVKFTVTNTASSPTLNVNSTGAKAIVYRGSAISAGYLAANRVYEFVYDGTDWELIGDVNTDTKNTAGSTNSSSKLFLVGATSQAANPQTYSHDTAYVGTDGCLYSNSKKVSVEGHNHAASNITSGTLSSDRLPTVPIAKGGTGATTATGALTNLGLTATASELNYMDGVTSNVQTQLDTINSSLNTLTSKIGNIKYDEISMEHTAEGASFLQCIKNNWESLETDCIYLLQVTVGSTKIALVQKYISHSYGSAIIFGYGTTPLYAYLNNGTWYDGWVAMKSDLSSYLPLSGGKMTGEIKIGQGDGKGIQLGTEGRINTTNASGSTNCTVLGMNGNSVLFGYPDFAMTLRGSSQYPTYNGVGLFLTSGGDLTGQLTFKTGTTQSETKGIKWQAIGSTNPYIGYATDQSDGTFIIANIKNTNYADGLSIGGSSGNLFWKSAKVMTTTNFSLNGTTLTITT